MGETVQIREVPANMLAIGPVAEAAKRLAKTLGPPRSHSIWVRSELGPELKYASGEPIPRVITPIICVARHPRFGFKMAVPTSFEGYSVREEPWQ